MFVFFILSFIFPSLLNSGQIKSYKVKGLDLSLPYTSIPSLQYTLIFTIEDEPIVSANYLILTFPVNIFASESLQSIINPTLTYFTETSGSHFSPLDDLTSGSKSSDSDAPNTMISTWGLTKDKAEVYFQLNYTLDEDMDYKLEFTVAAPFKDPAFLGFMEITFTSSLGEDGYIITQNYAYAFLAAMAKPDPFEKVIINQIPITYTENIRKQIKGSLVSTLDAFPNSENIVKKPKNVQIMNEMIDSMIANKRMQNNGIIYPEDVHEFPGFLGDMNVDVLLSQDIQIGSILEIVFPIGWSLDAKETWCLSTSLIVGEDKHEFFEHSQCQVEKQIVRLYILEELTAKSYIRINITNVRNPSYVGEGTLKLSIYNKKSKSVYGINPQVSGVKVATKSNIEMTLSSTYTEKTLNGSYYLAESTQELKLVFNVSYFDLSGI